MSHSEEKGELYFERQNIKQRELKCISFIIFLVVVVAHIQEQYYQDDDDDDVKGKKE